MRKGYRSHYRGRAAKVAFIASVAAISLLGCTEKKSKHGEAGPVPVLISTAVSMNVPRELQEIGTVEALNTVAITARVNGQLLRVGFQQGQEVSKGQMLFQIDPAPYQAALAQARANFDRDSASKANAERTVDRYQNLVGKGYVTRQDYETAVTTAAELKATVEADRSLLHTASLNLGYCTIEAPITGRTGNLLVTPGNLVAANSTNPLVIINQLSPIDVRFSLPEARLDEVRRLAQKDSLGVWASSTDDTAKIAEGKLTFVDNAIDRTTGTIVLKATFPNRDRALWPGQFVRAHLVLGNQKGAVVVPTPAVQTSQQGTFVFVVAPGDTVQLRNVAAGTEFNGMTVIERGVAAGEKVVSDGAMQLVAGSKVVAKTGLVPTAAPEAGTR